MCMKPGNSSQKLLSIQAVMTVLWNPDWYTECSDASMMPITSILQMPDNCLVGHRRKKRHIWLLSSDEDKSQKGKVCKSCTPATLLFCFVHTFLLKLSLTHAFVCGYSVIPEINALTLRKLCESFCWRIKMKALFTTYVIQMVRNTY